MDVGRPGTEKKLEGSLHPNRDMGDRQPNSLQLSFSFPFLVIFPFLDKAATATTPAVTSVKAPAFLFR